MKANAKYMFDEDFAKLPALAKHDVPLLHVCGSEDFLVDRYTRFVEDCGAPLALDQ